MSEYSTYTYTSDNTSPQIAHAPIDPDDAITSKYSNWTYTAPLTSPVAELFELYLSGVDLDKECNQYFEILKKIPAIGDDNLKAIAAFDRFKKMVLGHGKKE